MTIDRLIICIWLITGLISYLVGKMAALTSTKFEESKDGLDVVLITACQSMLLGPITTWIAIKYYFDEIKRVEKQIANMKRGYIDENDYRR